MNKEDLFEHQETLPQAVQDILNKYSTLDPTYINCEKLDDELSYQGYTFDYGLDAIPTDLRLIDNPIRCSKCTRVNNKSLLIKDSYCPYCLTEIS
jgi:hypothetical protein